MRRVPAALVIGFAGQMVFSAVSLVVVAAGLGDKVEPQLGLAGAGADIAVTLLAAMGLAELVARSTGRVALGLRIATYAFVGVFATWVVSQALFAFDIPSSEDEWLIIRWAFWTVAAIATAGLVVAAGWSRWYVLVLAAVWTLAYAPPILETRIDRWLGISSSESFVALRAIEQIAQNAILLGLVWLVPRGEVVSYPHLASAGFRRAANALWLRVIAFVVGMFLAFSAAAAHGDGASLLKYGVIAGTLVNMIAFDLFGVGLLGAARAAVPDLPRYPLAIAAAINLWCGGVLLAQLPAYYRLAFGHEGFGASYAQALTVAMPIATAFSGALVVGGVAAFARRRGLDDLRAHASSTGIAFVMLTLATVAIAAWLVHASSLGGALFALLAAAVCGLMAQVVLAKFCAATAIACEQDAGLPQAIARER